MSEPLERLGKLVQEHTVESPRSGQVLREVRTRLEMSALQRTRGTAFTLPKWAWAGGGALACAAVVLALGGPASLFSRSPEARTTPLSVTLESQATKLIGTWVVAESETKQLSFSDGTSLSLHPHTKLRVIETTPSGGTIDLGKGRTLAQIEPLEGAEWRFVAGPFSVRVTGTEFDLAWDPATGVLELALHQGSVTLSGPTLTGEKPVRKGEFVRVEVPALSASDTERRSKAQDDVSEDALPVDAPPVDAAPIDAKLISSEAQSKTKSAGFKSQSQASSSSEANSPPEAEPKTKASDNTGLTSSDPQTVLSTVDQLGSSKVLSTAHAQELWSLARAARLGGRPDLARDALLALRNRHGTRGETSYLLGKVHADQLKATAQAISWFETYLKEAPGGPLAEQAAGRLVELQAGTQRGKTAAKRYLALYPRGAYAEFSRSQLR